MLGFAGHVRTVINAVEIDRLAELLSNVSPLVGELRPIIAAVVGHTSMCDIISWSLVFIANLLSLPEIGSALPALTLARANATPAQEGNWGRLYKVRDQTRDLLLVFLLVFAGDTRRRTAELGRAGSAE